MADLALSEGEDCLWCRTRKYSADFSSYWIELATLEKVLFALDPISRTVPTTITRMTASITAYSAMSCPSSSCHNLEKYFMVAAPPNPTSNSPHPPEEGQ